jgi:hypothetical protein
MSCCVLLLLKGLGFYKFSPRDVLTMFFCLWLMPKEKKATDCFHAEREKTIARRRMGCLYG